MAHARMTDEEWDTERTRQRLIYTLPGVQQALREEYTVLVGGVSEAMAR